MKRNKVINTPCDACGRTPTDRAHLKTRGAGAGWNEDEFIHLCREHHIEQGWGWAKFADKYPTVMRQLTRKGWEIKDILGVRKLVRKDA